MPPSRAWPIPPIVRAACSPISPPNGLGLKDSTRRGCIAGSGRVSHDGGCLVSSVCCRAARLAAPHCHRAGPQRPRRSCPPWRFAIRNVSAYRQSATGGRLAERSYCAAPTDTSPPYSPMRRRSSRNNARPLSSVNKITNHLRSSSLSSRSHAKNRYPAKPRHAITRPIKTQARTPRAIIPTSTLRDLQSANSFNALELVALAPAHHHPRKALPA